MTAAGRAWVTTKDSRRISDLPERSGGMEAQQKPTAAGDGVLPGDDAGEGQYARSAGAAVATGGRWLPTLSIAPPFG